MNTEHTPTVSAALTYQDPSATASCGICAGADAVYWIVRQEETPGVFTLDQTPVVALCSVCAHQIGRALDRVRRVSLPPP